MSIGNRRSWFGVGVGVWMLTGSVGNAAVVAEEHSAPRLQVEGRTVDELRRLAPGEPFVLALSLLDRTSEMSAASLQPNSENDESSQSGRRRHVLIGSAIGAGIGAVWGGNTCRNDAAAVTCRYTWAAAAVGFGIGAGVGAIVGAFGGN